MRTASRQPQRASRPPTGIHTTEVASNLFDGARTPAVGGPDAKTNAPAAAKVSKSRSATLELPRKQAWYGVLETTRGRVPVAFDPALPQADKGQVYLLNLEREAIVPYQWSIVSELLREVDSEEQALIRQQARKLRKTVQSRFLASRGSQITFAKRTTPAAKPTLPVETDADDSWEGGLLDDMDFE